MTNLLSEPIALRNQLVHELGNQGHDGLAMRKLEEDPSSKLLVWLGFLQISVLASRPSAMALLKLFRRESLRAPSNIS